MGLRMRLAQFFKHSAGAPIAGKQEADDGLAGRLHRIDEDLGRMEYKLRNLQAAYKRGRGVPDGYIINCMAECLKHDIRALQLKKQRLTTQQGH